MARAAVALPISAVSQPKAVKISVTAFLALSSLPQMNMVGGPPFTVGLYICKLPTLLNAFTSLACGICFCSRSNSDSFKSVKNDNTPSVGGPPIGLVASITTLFVKWETPACFMADSATEPPTANTNISPNWAVTPKVPHWPLGLSFFQFFTSSLPGCGCPALLRALRLKRQNPISGLLRQSQ